MGYCIKQNQTAQPLMFLMIDSSDHITPKTGLSPTVTLSKNGASFASPSGAVSEVGSGWYKVAGNATDANTLGNLILHATGSGADPCDDQFLVVAYDPIYSTVLGNVNASQLGGASSFGGKTIDELLNALLAHDGGDISASRVGDTTNWTDTYTVKKPNGTTMFTADLVFVNKALVSRTITYA